MSTNYRATIETLSNGQKMPLRKLLGPLPANLKPLVKKLDVQIRTLTTNYSKGHFEIGDMLKTEIPKIEAELQKSGQTSYGSHLLRHLGMALDIHPRILTDCLRVAERFTAKKYEAGIVSNRLTWAHARVLAQLSDSPERDSLIAKTVAEKLNADELNTLIAVPKKPRGSGRAPAKPKNLQQALARLQKDSKTYCSTMQTVLFGEIYDIPTEIVNAPPDTLTAEFRKTVAECVEQLATIEKTAKDAQARLQFCLARIDATIISQKAYKDSTPPDENEIQAPKPHPQLVCAS